MPVTTTHYGPDGKPLPGAPVAAYFTGTAEGGFKQISKQEHDRLVAEADDQAQDD